MELDPWLKQRGRLTSAVGDWVRRGFIEETGDLARAFGSIEEARGTILEVVEAWVQSWTSFDLFTWTREAARGIHRAAESQGEVDQA